MNFSEFFGRLHPLVVHLPIGFLLIAVLLEWFKGKDASKGKNRAIVFILFLGAISAIIAAVFGWLLANDGYDENTLFWHKWLGISTAVFAIIAWWTKRKKEKKIYKLSIWSIAILLLVTGHFGGSLTHGSDYLLQPLQGDADKIDLAANLPKQPDSVQVYNHLIQPVLEQKCYSCHNPEKKQGGLDMTTWDALLEGGENGHVFENDVWKSELFKRVTLPEDSKKFMPPKGIPLNYSEKILLKWWIAQGANPESKIVDNEVSEEVQQVLMNSYGLDTRPRPFVERAQVSAVDDAIILQLGSKGWKVDRLGEKNNLLEISKAHLEKPIPLSVSDLMPIKEQLTWLNLADTKITDDDLKVIAQFPNLSRLRLENNEVTDVGIQHLTVLSHLESLNLYNNRITDAGLLLLEKLPALTRVYLWKTDITQDGISKLSANRPEMEIISGQNN